MNDLDQTRQRLQQIPDLYAQLPRFLVAGSAPAGPDEHRSARRRPGSPALVSLDVLALLASRKTVGTLEWLGWDGSETRHDWQRHGTEGTLELWAMLIQSELADLDRTRPDPDETVVGWCNWLIYDLAWIVDHHPDFPRSIRNLHSALQRACRVRPPMELTCPRCGAAAFVDETARFLQCQLEPSHEVGISDLEFRWRRRPAKPTKEILAEFPGLTAKDLHDAARGPKLNPVRDGNGKMCWWPWEVLLLTSPALAEVFEHRDRLAGDTA